MQRKNNILRLSHRSGFAMILAMGVIVILASIMALSLSMTSQTTKQTTDLYLYEQAVLLSKSATEYALLQIAQNPPCTITNLNFDEGVYNINIDIRYVYFTPSPCANAVNDYFEITTSESNGSVMMDVTVSTDAATEPIRFFRRSIQKL